MRASPVALLFFLGDKTKVTAKTATIRRSDSLLLPSDGTRLSTDHVSLLFLLSLLFSLTLSFSDTSAALAVDLSVCTSLLSTQY